jgi:hypothetical protein
MPVEFINRAITRFTCNACHLLLPLGVGNPNAVKVLGFSQKQFPDYLS